MVFNIGDKVRYKHDRSDIQVLVVRADVKGVGLLCVSECGRRVSWAQPEELDLDRRFEIPLKVDIKQAIREVLLSDEFLQAFAAAWQRTPILHESELNLIACKYTGEGFAETAMKNYKSPEIIASTIEPITKSESEAVALRNRFRIGDKAVDRCTGSLAVVKNINESDGECEIQFEENHRYAYRWVSELSLFEKKVSNRKPSSIDANAINQNGESE